MAVGELRKMLRDPFLNNFAAQEPVAYVTMTGDFYVEGAPVLHKGFIVFDVLTGNNLMNGAQ